MRTFLIVNIKAFYVFVREGTDYQAYKIPCR